MQRPVFNKPQQAMTADQYMQLQEELARRNAGGFTAVGQDVPTNLPYAPSSGFTPQRYMQYGVVRNPNRPKAGSRLVPTSRNTYIDLDTQEEYSLGDLMAGDGTEVAPENAGVDLPNVTNYQDISQELNLMDDLAEFDGFNNPPISGDSARLRPEFQNTQQPFIPPTAPSVPFGGNRQVDFLGQSQQQSRPQQPFQRPLQDVVSSNVAEAGRSLGLPEMNISETIQKAPLQNIFSGLGKSVAGLGKRLSLPEMNLSERIAGLGTVQASDVGRDARPARQSPVSVGRGGGVPQQPQLVNRPLASEAVPQQAQQPMRQSPTQQPQQQGQILGAKTQTQAKPDYVSPFTGSNVVKTQTFNNVNPKLNYLNNTHKGTDYDYSGAPNKLAEDGYSDMINPIGGQIMAVEANNGTGYGNSMVIRGYNPQEYNQLSQEDKANADKDEDYVRLSHLADLPGYEVGDYIGTGEARLKMGSTGNSTARHLDLEAGQGNFQDFDKKEDVELKYPGMLQNTPFGEGGIGGGGRGNMFSRLLGKGDNTEPVKSRDPMGMSFSVPRAGEGIKKIQDEIQPRVDSAMNKFSQLKDQPFKRIGETSANIAEGVDSIKSTIGNKIGDVAQKGTDAVKGGVMSAVNNVKNVIGGGGTTTTNVSRNVTQPIQSKGTTNNNQSKPTTNNNNNQSKATPAPNQSSNNNQSRAQPAPNPNQSRATPQPNPNQSRAQPAPAPKATPAPKPTPAPPKPTPAPAPKPAPKPAPAPAPKTNVFTNFVNWLFRR
jgi:hypothetical protein